MVHTHDHSPRPDTASYGRAFAIGIILNSSFVLLEAAWGYWSHSLALVADAGHNLSDVLGLLLAWSAVWLMRHQPTQKRTYGFRRSSILAALINAVILLVAIGGIAWEALRRLGTPQEIAGSTVIWIASLGVLINTATALLFMAGRQQDLNMQGAFLHMATDAAVSLGVVGSGLLMLFTGWMWLDAVVSLAVLAVILGGTWRLLRDAVNLSLDAVPSNIDIDGVRRYLTRLPGVQSVHDLHIWGISTTETALTAHLIMPDATFTDAFLTQTARNLHDHFRIAHTTLQVETGDPNQRCHSCGPIHHYQG
ncbi:MAG: cation diffusion facilitator family transporter [Candidatus Tectimicrobiota bacterium]